MKDGKLVVFFKLKIISHTAATISGFSISPSTSLMILLPYAAFSFEWVTWMIVIPSSFSFFNSFMMISPCSECRLPVGSSARSSFGLPAMARAMATSCCCPPESWFGKRSFLATMLNRSSKSATIAFLSPGLIPSVN
jgi:hypothetical protein